MSISKSDSYAAAGVDVTAGYESVNRIKPLVESTNIPGVIGGLGGFGGLFAPDLTGMKEPVMVSGTDGVGTKLKIAFLMDKHDTVGIDCVATISYVPVQAPCSSWTMWPAARTIPHGSSRLSPVLPRDVGRQAVR